MANPTGWIVNLIFISLRLAQWAVKVEGDQASLTSQALLMQDLYSIKSQRLILSQ